MLFNQRIGGSAGVSASIFAYGDVQSTDTVYAKKNGNRINGVWKMRQKLNPAWHGLPPEYQEVEYLESTGEQWIDTLISPTQDTNFLVKYSYKSGTVGRVLGSSTKFLVSVASKLGASSVQMGWDGAWEPAQSYNFPKPKFNDIVTLSKTGLELFCEIGVEEKSYTLTSKTLSDGETIKLFGAGGSLSTSVIYSANIDNKTFIPCYRISDNKPGMYDLVNDVFYVNQGTGADFLVGNDVPQFITERGFEIAPINEYGTWVLTAINGTITKTIDVLVDAAEEINIEVLYSA